MKKTLFPILFIILIFAIPVGIFAEPAFPDCSGHWAEAYINHMQAKGIINGYEDGTFRPDGRITRAEFITILANMNSFSEESFPLLPSFTDVPREHWAYNMIEWACANHLVSGYEDGSFRPSAYISRQEMAVLIYRYITAYKGLTPLTVTEPTLFLDNEEISAWAKNEVYAMEASGILSGRGEGLFAPLATATRAETAKIITVYLQYYETREETPAGSVTLKVNGEIKATAVPTASENGYTLIAARSFFEAAGFTVKYYGMTALVVAYSDSKDIEFFLDRTLIFINGIKYALPTPARLQNGTTFIPLSMAAFVAGFTAEYDDNGKELKLTGSLSPLATGCNNFFGTVSASSVNGSVFLSHGTQVGFWGTLVNGQMTYGSYVSGNGDLFCGQWQNGVLNGAARSVTVNGEFFYGIYNNGNMASGVRYYSDGSAFDGTFQTAANGANYPQKGQYTTADGQIYGNHTTVWNGGSLSQSEW